MTFEPRSLGSIAGSFLLGFPALFSIINPVGSSLIFYSVTKGRTHADRSVLARRISTYALAILLGRSGSAAMF